MNYKVCCIAKGSSCNSSGSSQFPYLANKTIVILCLKEGFGLILVAQHDPYVYCMQLRSTVYSHHLMRLNMASAIKKVSVNSIEIQFNLAWWMVSRFLWSY
jgi:hypothetical protein